MLRRLFTLVSLCMLAGCANRNGSAPRMPSGERYAVTVHVDAPDSAQAELAAWMQDDLTLVLRKFGYSAAPGDQAAPAPGHLSLRVRITSYDGGNRPVRLVINVGGGRAALRTHFELADQKSGLLVGDPEVSSGRDWRNAGHHMDLQIAELVNGRMQQLVATEK